MTRFVKDPTFESKMEKEPGTIAFVDTTTGGVAEIAEDIAPKKTGYYARRIRHLGARVQARDPFWHLVEFGSVKNTAYAPLRRAVIAAGLKLKPSPKK